jgi:hypothetical protein
LLENRAAAAVMGRGESHAAMFAPAEAFAALSSAIIATRVAS